MKRYHVKKGSKVFVNSGKWKGEVATIKAILSDKDRVVLEFADAKDRKIGRRTLKRSQANPNGGMVERNVYGPEEAERIYRVLKASGLSRLN